MARRSVAGKSFVPRSHLQKCRLFIITCSFRVKDSYSIVNQYKHIPDTRIMTKCQIHSPTELIQLHIHRQDICKNLTRGQMEPSFLEVHLAYTSCEMTAALMQGTSSE